MTIRELIDQTCNQKRASTPDQKLIQTAIRYLSHSFSIKKV